MLDHWLFVLAAYALTAAVLLGYWWRLERRLRALTRRRTAPEEP